MPYFIVYMVANKVFSVLFETREQAEKFCEGYGASSGLQITELQVIRKVPDVG